MFSKSILNSIISNKKLKIFSNLFFTSIKSTSLISLFCNISNIFFIALNALLTNGPITGRTFVNLLANSDAFFIFSLIVSLGLI